MASASGSDSLAAILMVKLMATTMVMLMVTPMGTLMDSRQDSDQGLVSASDRHQRPAWELDRLRRPAWPLAMGWGCCLRRGLIRHRRRSGSI